MHWRRGFATGMAGGGGALAAARVARWAAVSVRGGVGRSVFIGETSPVTLRWRRGFRRSTATSAGARTAECRRWTSGPRQAPGRYGATQHARAREDSEEPRGAAHGGGARLGRRVVLGGAWCGCLGRPARGRGAAAPWPGHLLVPCLSAFFSKNLYRSASSDE
jgi:hypothetical protein